MCADVAPKNRPVDPKRLIRPQSRLDIILDVDIFTGQADVRNSMIMDITTEHIVAAQSDPQILKSRTDSVVEASVVHTDLVTYEATRWGWKSRILGINNDYKLNPKDPASPAASVIFLTLPPRDGLTRTNIRQAYRLDVGVTSSITLAIIPQDDIQVHLINFSAGGLMLNTPTPSFFSLGQELGFNLAFPATSNFLETVIKGRATVVRMEYEPGESLARVGLKFDDLSPATSRTLEKIINHYMLEEQRKRNRE